MINIGVFQSVLLHHINDVSYKPVFPGVRHKNGGITNKKPPVFVALVKKFIKIRLVGTK